MATDVIIPALGMAQDTGKILRWLKHEGAAVSKGDPLLEVETDKVTVEVEATATGILTGVVAREGDELPVGTIVARIAADGESVSAPAREPSSPAASPPARAEPVDGVPRGRRAVASPKARRVAQAHGIDLSTVEGSGPGGAIVAADLRITADASLPDGARVGPSRVWRVMAERLTRSWQEAPQFAVTREIDASRLLAWRAAAREANDDVTLTDLLVAACAAVLTKHGGVLARWEDGTLVPGDAINVGIAVAIDDGLVVPVVHDVDRLSITEIAARRRELVDRARAARLTPADITGGTFTLSNLGMYDVDSFRAIVNPPEAAILAVGRIRDAVVPVDGAAQVRPVTTLTLACDHRAVDGARAAQFLAALAASLEEPLRLSVPIATVTSR
jgi:pyruvate dehydrogenase E2 component (dihydrolipoamide acetyltransferase)